MGGKILAEDISNQTVASVPSKEAKRIEVLEDLVDSLNLEVASLKKKLASKSVKYDKDYKTLYEKLLPELQNYFDTLHPF